MSLLVINVVGSLFKFMGVFSTMGTINFVSFFLKCVKKHHYASIIVFNVAVPLHNSPGVSKPCSLLSKEERGNK